MSIGSGLWRGLSAGAFPAGSQRGILFGPPRFDLVEHQSEPVDLAADLRLQIRRQRAPVAGAHRLKPRSPVAPQGRVTRYPLCEQEAFDPVHMRDAFVDQGPAFATEPAAVLLLRRRG